MPVYVCADPLVHTNADRVSAPARLLSAGTGRERGKTRNLSEARHARESYTPKAACRRTNSDVLADERERVGLVV